MPNSRNLKGKRQKLERKKPKRKLLQKRRGKRKEQKKRLNVGPLRLNNKKRHVQREKKK